MTHSCFSWRGPGASAWRQPWHRLGAVNLSAHLHFLHASRPRSTCPAHQALRAKTRSSLSTRTSPAVKKKKVRRRPIYLRPPCPALPRPAAHRLGAGLVPPLLRGTALSTYRTLPSWTLKPVSGVAPCPPALPADLGAKREKDGRDFFGRDLKPGEKRPKKGSDRKRARSPS